MFLELFRSELDNATSDKAVADRLYAQVQNAYREQGRHYHNLLHLDHIARQLFPARYQIKDLQTLVFSIAYHDIVYDVSRKDNEEKSADIAVEILTDLDVPARQVELCREQILATAGHGVSGHSDTNYFTDADLSILGSDDETYAAYAAGIRMEYAIYPEILYNPGRIAVLQKFLEMPRIFKTGFFAEKFENQARLNISNELKVLNNPKLQAGFPE